MDGFLAQFMDCCSKEFVLRTSLGFSVVADVIRSPFWGPTGHLSWCEYIPPGLDILLRSAYLFSSALRQYIGSFGERALVELGFIYIIAMEGLL